MFDFVDPACTRRRMIDCSCELRVDELQRHASDLSEAEEIATPLMARLNRQDAERMEAAGIEFINGSGQGWQALLVYDI